MSIKIPCPNPVCPHDFTQAELQAATSLQCPKCGFRMQGRAPEKSTPPTKAPTPPAPKPNPAAKAPARPAPKPAVAAPKAAPAASPPKAEPKPPLATPISPTTAAAPPLATPIAPGDAPPLATPVTTGAEMEEDFFNPEVAADAAPLVRGTQKPKKPVNWHRVALNSLVIGFAVCIVIVAITGVLWLALGSGRFGGLDGDGSIHYGFIRGPNNESEKVYRLVLPKNEWSIDTEVQRNLDAHVAWKSVDYDFWFALVVKDYVTFKPRDAELLRIGIDKLEAQFGEAIELNKMAEPARIGEIAAQKLRFKGLSKSAFWEGEVYMFFHHGVAYWLYVASPHWPTVEHFAAEIPARNFTVLSERRGWTAQPIPTETFTSDSGKLTLTAPKGGWEKHPAKNEDQNGDLFLFGRYLKEKDNRKNASMLILTIEKKDDLQEAIKAAREYVNNRAKADNANNKIVHASEVIEGQTELGSVEDIGNRRGRVVDLKLLVMDETKRYHLLAVVNEPDVCYAILGDCAWESRQLWRQDFIELLRTLRVQKKE